MKPAPSFNLAEWLEQSRIALESTLSDTVRVDRETVGTPDELGTDTLTLTEVWTGPGLIQYITSTTDATSARIVAGQATEPGAYAIKLPNAVPVEVDDIVTCTASHDARQVGRAWRVTVVPFQGWNVLRRCLADPIEDADTASDSGAAS